MDDRERGEFPRGTKCYLGPYPMNPEGMFLDWSPLPSKVLYVTHYSHEFAFKKSFYEFEIRRVLLNMYCYSINGGEEYRSYGWEPETKTVLIYREN